MEKPLYTNMYLVIGQGLQEGANGCRTRRQKQAYDTGRRDERQSLAGGGWEENPGGQRTTPEEDVGSR